MQKEYSVNIELSQINDVKEFVDLALCSSEDIIVTSENNKYRVNGKSVLGLFSLDLSKPVNVESYDKEFLCAVIEHFN